MAANVSARRVPESRSKWRFRPGSTELKGEKMENQPTRTAKAKVQGLDPIIAKQNSSASITDPEPLLVLKSVQSGHFRDPSPTESSWIPPPTQ
jgi:hypothetical protein